MDDQQLLHFKKTYSDTHVFADFLKLCNILVIS